MCTDSTSSRPILIVFLPSSLNEQSHTPSSGTSRDSLDPVLLTPDYTFAHAPIPRDEGSPRHRLEREEDDYNHTHTQSPGIVTADHLPPGFIPTSPSFVPLVLGGNAKGGESEGGGTRGANGRGYERYAESHGTG